MLNITFVIIYMFIPGHIIAEGKHGRPEKHDLTGQLRTTGNNGAPSIPVLADKKVKRVESAFKHLCTQLPVTS